MLIEFNVSNFRSFGETQKFSLVASNYEKNLPENKIARLLPGMSGLDYLSVAVLYGANASGKSNLLMAFSFLCNFVRKSFRSDPNQPTCAAPFKLSERYQHLPTTFEIVFVVDEVRYRYYLSLTAERVIAESFTAYPKGRAQKWYSRDWNDKDQDYDKDIINGPVKKGLLQIIDQTRPNAAVLSAAAYLNHSQLTRIYKWFTQSVMRLNFADAILSPIHTIETMGKSQEQYAKVFSLLQNADFDIIKGQVNEKELSDDELNKIIPLSALAKIQKQKEENQSSFMSVSVSFFHKGKEGEIEMNFDNEESAGTKRYFSLLGPLLDVLDKGSVLLVDELETCLHPLSVVELIKLFRGKNNRNGAQLIFTTHNPLLLDESLLRRDQIWFTEKKQNGETNLYPLSDFSPRKGEALVKGYLAGRYGGIPFIPNGLGLGKSE